MEIDYIAVGKRVAQKRHQLGLTQQKVCDLIEISDKYMSNIECGKSKTSLQVLSNIAVALETTLDYLVFGIPDPENRQNTDELYNKIQSLPKDKIDFINALLSVL